MRVEVDHVSHVYPGPSPRRVLDDVTVELTQRRVGVIGANGSGKSTFLRLMNGLIVPDAGHVRVDGLDTAKDAREVRRRVGFCFTDPDNQIIMPTVAEDVAFGLRKAKLPKDEVAGRVDVLLRRFGLEGHAEHPAHLLSGGQKQLLALASVLITEPDLLIMDEPTTLLDLRNAAEIGRVVGELDQSVLLATHHLYLLESFDRVLVFDGGRIVADDAPGPAIAFYRELMGVA
ncbi:energy-coupling factor ABC transporter ATP-binding protein [Nigerium massiliense]|uniref:energy-coupling factor ABC transporter ATP-binding protein n=1 Tax=Nigerium massiliense TaxID=1522317 RepID=UPI00058D38CD|nr:ABC transporter ATP-binding protein [Nigerium massiliense]